MPSIVWGRDPEEAFEEPYEYSIQDQFSREAHTLFSELYKLLNSDQHRYSVDDRSRDKAIWLLAMDALDSLRECLDSLDRKEHRIAGKLFRDITESMDLALYFHYAARTDDDSTLRKWYSNEVIPHRRYRDYMKKVLGDEVVAQLAQHYSSLSRLTHRSYHSILGGYSLGAEKRLVHDRSAELYGTEGDSSKFLVVPHTISSYYAMLANVTLEYSTELSELNLISHKAIQNAYSNSWETETVPRRFIPRRWLLNRLINSYQKDDE